MPTRDKMLIEEGKERSLIVQPETNKIKLELKNISWSEVWCIQEKSKEKQSQRVLIRH